MLWLRAVVAVVTKLGHNNNIVQKLSTGFIKKKNCNVFWIQAFCKEQVKSADAS